MAKGLEFILSAQLFEPSPLPPSGFRAIVLVDPRVNQFQPPTKLLLKFILGYAVYNYILCAFITSAPFSYVGLKLIFSYEASLVCLIKWLVSRY